MRRAWPWISGRRQLGTLLRVAIVVVVLVGGATAWVVVASLGPVIFRDHMGQADASGSNAAQHAEEAFRSASALSLAVALTAALIASVAVSFFATRRITSSLSPLTEAAGRVADGDYTARVPSVGMGTEFDELSAAFNTMSSDLGRIELTRTRLLGDLAHEMRTPVTTLGAYLEAIAEGVEKADAGTLAMLGDQVTRLARLSDDIALVITAEEGGLSLRRQTVKIGRVVTDVTTQATARFAAKGAVLEVRVTSAAASSDVDADADRIGQVLINLLDNALRHTRPQGRVVVTADRQGGAVRVTVADNGDGIPAEHLPYVFDRFYRVDKARDRAHGGSGVGLAIARAITEAHGGTISVSSDGPGLGATFVVELPLQPAASA